MTVNTLFQVKKRWTTASTRVCSRWIRIHAHSSTLRFRQSSQTRNEGPDETVQSILLIAELDWMCLFVSLVSRTVSFPPFISHLRLSRQLYRFPPSATGVFLVTKIYYYYCILQLALWSGFSRRKSCFVLIFSRFRRISSPFRSTRESNKLKNRITKGFFEERCASLVGHAELCRDFRFRLIIFYNI